MPLRIAIDARHITDFGIGTYIRNLTQALGRIDSEDRYSLVAPSPPDPAFATLPKNFSLVTYQRQDTQLADQFLFGFLLRTLNVDLYHIPLARVPLWMPGPYVVTVHDLSGFLYGAKQGLRNELNLYRLKRGLSRASCVITVSEATRHDVENVLAVRPRAIRLVYNAPDPFFTEHSAQSAASLEAVVAMNQERLFALARYQINYPFILYAGTIRPQKNIPRLVEAFAVVRGDLEGHPLYHDLRLLIIGDEISRYPAVRQAVMQTRMEEHVRFLGFVPMPTLRAFYESAAVFVFPSLYEGFGLPPLEAMACGTPAVVSNVSSLPEVVGDAAVLVNPENVFDIARGIREALVDEKLRQKLIDKGRERAQRFSWDKTAEQVLETYREVAEER